MKLLRGAWTVLVGIKDALVLMAMLIFFGLLFAALSAAPNAGMIRDGALVLDLNGAIVEEPSEPNPFDALTSGGADAPRDYRRRDLVRALDAARTDKRVKAVVLDLDRFGGGYPATVADVAEALGRVRAAGKPVLAYATAYSDSGYLLAAHASEIWVNPIGGVLFSGPGGSRLYYKGLIDRLGVNAHIYRVGTYKSAVEPYLRTDQSPEARAANEALYGTIFAQWREAIAKARPRAQIAQILTQPDQVVAAANGDIARANQRLGMIDKVGDRLAFERRVATIAGAPTGKPAGTYSRIRLANWIEANPVVQTGDAIGVITVAGEIVDGNAGPGTAGGDRIARQLLKGLAEKKVKALVVRVDSPGGSVTASERIRQAILQAKAQGLPVVVSMGGLAASGGYWVSTPGDVIFAEPNTITGSIGIFGIIPTFEATLARIGVTADGVATTPLTGQPDIYRGTNAVTDRVLQSSIEAGYQRFLNLVAQSRRMTTVRVNEIGQGRVWDGGTARQNGLVDRHGGLEDAIAEAARRAKLDPAKVHPVYFEKEPDAFSAFLASLMGGDDDEEGAEPAGDVFAMLGRERQSVLAQAIGDLRRLTMGGSIQARCLECVGFGPVRPTAADRRILDMLMLQAAR